VQRCYLNDELIGEVKVVTNEKVERKKWNYIFVDVLNLFLKLAVTDNFNI
jgi:hypothetical protein